MKLPSWLKITMILLFLLSFAFVACTGAAEAKGGSVSAKPSVPESKPTTSSNASKPATTSKQTSTSGSTNQGKTNTTSSYKPTSTVTYSAKSSKQSSYYALSNKKLDFSRPYKSFQNYDYQKAASNTYYYSNSFLSNYLDYLIIENLMNDEEKADKNKDNDAWLLMYMILR
ncbi:hypothetical protein [Acetobacterium wieringae]|uniref:Lipoprotein n=1 Tax=Acetobacterium wieringae TaxID=52694 RepID=A0A1F2PEG9_9FIRM|nr:hypothetical protein [Acetobacterium wieringae]OFV69272.1 hypothetical protein ACWI_33160 [Acetobacterium wieringae]